jgi:D-inositol-3-phosphate glycosyltransferase
VVIGGNPAGDENGISEEMVRLQDLCGELGLSDLVLFVGKRSQETLPYYYSAAEIVVVPSHYESFGMVALEAMACGTPVVASQVGGLAYLVKDGVTGFVVPNDDPVALGEQLTELVNQTELRRILGEQAAEYAIDYDWGKISRQIVDLYHAVLDGKSPCGTTTSYH